MSHRSIVPIGSFLLLFLSLDTSPLLAQVYRNDPGYRNDPTKPWNRYLEIETKTLAQRTERELAEVTKENWDEKRIQWREELQEMLGLKPWPARGDLAPTITGSAELEGVHVDNLHYQPSPGLYVAANLYLPTGEVPKGGWPAVLYVCGHARVDEFGRLQGNKTSYQHHGLWLARHGFACLTIDTIQLGEFQGEHHGTFQLGRWDWITKGYTPAGVEAWSAIRAMDYLQSRNDINKEQVGITGRSGGGAYSWFAAALDERFGAAVPVAGITDLQNHVVDGCVEGHCDCMFMVNKYRWDYGKLAALIAPRPLMLTNTDTDRIFPFDGVVRIHRQLESLYAALGVPTNYGILIAPGPHKDIQELQVGAFKWLSRNLTGNELIVDSAAEKLLQPHQLRAFPRSMPLNERVTDISGWFVPQAENDQGKSWEAKGKEWFEEVWNLEQPPVDPEDSTTIIAQSYWKVAEGNVNGWRWTQHLSRPPSGWGSGWIELSKGEGGAKGPIHVHVGAWQGLKLSEPSQGIQESDLGNWLMTGEIAGFIDPSKQENHYILLPQGWDLAQQVPEVRELTHMHRRFYLLGDSLEQVQLRADWNSLVAICSANRENNNGITLNGYGRSTISTALLGWKGIWDDQQRVKITGMRLAAHSEDPRLSACFPSFTKNWSYSSVIEALSEKVPVTRPLSEASKENLVLVDTSHEPKLATGVKVYNVGSDEATFYGRATRWPLPNLADRSDLKKEDEVSDDGVAGLPHAVPGVLSELRIRWKLASNNEWKQTAWRSVDASTDFGFAHKVKGLKPDSSYDVQVETKGKGSKNSSTTASSSFKTLPESGKSSKRKIAIGIAPSFEDRDGPFGFDTFRTMQDRKIDYLLLAGASSEFANPLQKGPSSVDPTNQYHWQRMNGLPSLVSLSRRIPIGFLGTSSEEDVGMSSLSIGKDLQIFSLARGDDEKLNEVVASNAKFNIVVINPTASNPGSEEESKWLVTLREKLRSKEGTILVSVSPKAGLGSATPKDGANATEGHREFVINKLGDRSRGGEYLELEITDSNLTLSQIGSSGEVIQETRL